jgi:hypothetical protein
MRAYQASSALTLLKASQYLVGQGIVELRSKVKLASREARHSLFPDWNQSRDWLARASNNDFFTS